MQIIKGEQYFKVRSFANVPEMLRQSVELFGDNPAVKHRLTPSSEIETKTYKELFKDTVALVSFLRKNGRRGRRIAVVGENSYHWIIAYLAAVCGAGIVIPLDRMLPPEEIRQLLIRSEADTVFYDSAFLSLFSADDPELPVDRICMRSGRLKEQDRLQLLSLTAGSADSGVDLPDIGVEARHFLMEQLLEAPPELDRLPENEIDPDTMMALLFTSGTTSMSKGVMLSHTNVCADVQGITGMVELNPGLRMLSILPLHHTFENTCGLLVALFIGACIHVCDGLRYIQKNMQEYAIEMIIGVPAVFENFYQKVMDKLQKTGKDKTIKKVRGPVRFLRKLGIDLRKKLFGQIIDAFGGAFKMGICGAAPIDPEIIRFFDDIGVRILQGYGLTETSPVVAGCNSKIFVPGTVGRPVSHVEVAVDSEHYGIPGEILVRGDIVMLGYFQDEAATAEVIDAEGWFHTGDIGVIDPRRKCLTITGRKKSMIVLKSGKKVFPEEVEYLFNQFDFIRESLVWGEPTDDGDVIVSAKFVLDEQTLSEKHGVDPADSNGVQKLLDQMIKEVNARMPSFKSIRQHVFSFRGMVKTTTLKIKRQIEIDHLKELMERQKLRWRELTGKNLDSYDNQQEDQDNDKK